MAEATPSRFEQVAASGALQPATAERLAHQFRLRANDACVRAIDDVDTARRRTQEAARLLDEAQPPAPLIFKVLPAIKSRDQVIATARDIARLNGRHMKAGIEPGVIYDEAACPVYEGYPPPHVASALLDEALKLWHLKPDEQNLSTTARALLASGDHDALKALPKGDRLRHRQAYQIIISVRSSHDPTGGERLLEAVGDAVIDVFGGCGYHAFYALNTTGEHPNVRLLVCAQNRRPPYRRLRFSRY